MAEKFRKLLDGARPTLTHRAVERGKEISLGLGAVEWSGFDGDDCSSAFACVFDERHGGPGLKREVVEARKRCRSDLAAGIGKAADELQFVRSVEGLKYPATPHLHAI